MLRWTTVTRKSVRLQKSCCTVLRHGRSRRMQIEKVERGSAAAYEIGVAGKLNVEVGPDELPIPKTVGRGLSPKQGAAKKEVS